MLFSVSSNGSSGNGVGSGCTNASASTSVEIPRQTSWKRATAAGEHLVTGHAAGACILHPRLELPPQVSPGRSELVELRTEGVARSALAFTLDGLGYSQH